MMRLRVSVGENDPGLAFVWAFVLAGFINAFFQSTFEAPYAAVAFWSMLAVLCVMNRQVEDPNDEDEDVQEGIGALPDRGMLNEGEFAMRSKAT